MKLILLLRNNILAVGCDKYDTITLSITCNEYIYVINS